MVRAICRLLVDVGIWLAASAAFLAIYVGIYSLPGTAVLPHVRLVGVAWLAVAAVRLLANALPRFGSLWLCSAALAASWMLLLTYYFLVIAGLNGWGQVITSDLIRTYALQLPALVDVLGISETTVMLILVGAFVVLFAAAFTYLHKFDWVPAVRARCSRSLAVFISAAALATVAIEGYALTAAPWTREREPISLTLFPREASRQMQAHRIDRVQAELLDRAEDVARSRYLPATSHVAVNVVLIVVDALRADHLSLLGYGRPTTPELERWLTKADSAVAMTAHGSCAESACGLMSLATSKYVHQFSFRPITINEVLKRNGYSVHLILGGDHTHFYGLREVYGTVDSYFDASVATSYYMNDDRAVLAQFAKMPRWNGSPTMFQFHLMSAHALGRRQRGFGEFEPAKNYATLTNQEVTDGHASPTAVNYYDNGVRQADTVIAELLGQLKDKGYLSKAVVVITADHGELLGEHGLYTHAKSVYEEVLRVPFVLMSFGHRLSSPIPQTVPAAQVDMAPTILRALDLPIPSTWSGVPLQDAQERRITYYQEGFCAGLYDYRSPVHRWKYYVDMRSGSEYVADFLGNPSEQERAAAPVDAQRIREWRALVLPTFRGPA